jgi:ubiquinone/menaquinone biosynthesis C-methylase UbiE
MGKDKNPYVCPAGAAGSLDNSFRRWVHKPEKILKTYIKDGMTVLDLGCGPGVFTVEIAKLVRAHGKVIAADLQDDMLKIVAAKIKGSDLESRIMLHKCEKNSIGLAEKADFILAFWMIHEVPDHERLFNELKLISKPGGKLLIVEPRFHVSRKAFEKMSSGIQNTGFEIIDTPKVFFSRSLLLTRNPD